MSSFVQQFRKELWSPYVAGIFLGITGILAVWLSDSLLGASGAFENVAGMIGKAIAPETFNNMYFNFIMPPELTWGVMLFIGTILGGFLGALSSGTFKFTVNGDSQWKAIFGPQTWKRWVPAFLGAIVLEYGAGIAGGCTSGLAISGGMLLAPAAFIFIAGMFASGIVTALIVYRKRY
ncbi:MAG TPA: YeeE/YedE thiosulfate transporter family protein [Anaerolineales bacterium]|nr:YeeE/YedE thiosulfate transporter family protein [Anaerolineales bacterium]